MAFTYFVMLPAAIPFLVNFLGVETRPRLANYVQFTTNLMFWVGLSFETPLVMYILARLHLVTAKMLASAWRYAIVIIAILAAFITPTADPFNMILLMIPLILLYILSIFMTVLAAGGKPKEKKPKIKKPKRGLRIFRFLRRRKNKSGDNSSEIDSDSVQ